MLQRCAIVIRAAVLLVDPAEQPAELRRRVPLLAEGLLELTSEAPVHRQAGSSGICRFRDERALSGGGASLREGCANTCCVP